MPMLIRHISHTLRAAAKTVHTRLEINPPENVNVYEGGLLSSFNT